MIDFARLRDANVRRDAIWDPEKKLSLSFRGNELAGETGEACNCLKKLDRERLGLKGSRTTLEALGEELADIIICTDLAAMAAGIPDLWEEVRKKFNATSEKQGFDVRL